MGFSRQEILERVAISFSREFPDPGIEPASFIVSCIAGRQFFTTVPLGIPHMLRGNMAKPSLGSPGCGLGVGVGLRQVNGIKEKVA